jgi:hypothetical protein
MKRQNLRSHFLPLALGALVLAGAPAKGATPFGEADIFFELNHTDGDLGIHARIDGEGWERLFLSSPDGKEKLRVVTSGTMKSQGLTELFFESAEPPFDELPPERFFKRFKEGQWEITARTIDGDELESKDMLSHVMPAPPEGITISGEPAAEDCDASPLPSVGEPIVIRWDPVTESHPDVGKTGPIEVVAYQLVVEFEHPVFGDLNFSVILPPDTTEFEVPAEFADLSDGELKFEILVRERFGNQTAIESCFEIE